MESRYDLAIAGAGIMGLGCALAAAIAGKKVVIFDRSLDSEKASWAAAGILVTRDAKNFMSPFREFYVKSIHQYPSWLQTIAKLTGEVIPLHRGGDFQIYDLDSANGVAQFKAKTNQLEKEKSQNYTVTSTLPHFLAPYSKLKNVVTLQFPHEAYIQNRDLLSGLYKACEVSGVEFVGKEMVFPPIFSVNTTKLQFQNFSIEAKQLLLTAGVGTEKLLASLGIGAPIIPVKGQMMRIPKFYSENCMVHFNENIYLVPRGDSLIVGATTEPGVWDRAFDQKGETYISEHLQKLLPEVSKSAVESWAGLRPRTKDRLPWMGWLDAEKGWAICTGHYKCGISMAPLAAECMTRLMCGGVVPFDLAPFNPWRVKGLKIG